MEDSRPEYKLLREIIASSPVQNVKHVDRRVVKVARGLWKHWWPTQEPQDAEDYAKWWKIAFADAEAAVAALDASENEETEHRCRCTACESEKD